MNASVDGEVDDAVWKDEAGNVVLYGSITTIQGDLLYSPTVLEDHDVASALIEHTTDDLPTITAAWRPTRVEIALLSRAEHLRVLYGVGDNADLRPCLE